MLRSSEMTAGDVLTQRAVAVVIFFFFFFPPRPLPEDPKRRCLARVCCPARRVRHGPRVWPHVRRRPRCGGGDGFVVRVRGRGPSPQSTPRRRPYVHRALTSYVPCPLSPPRARARAPVLPSRPAPAAHVRQRTDLFPWRPQVAGPTGLPAPPPLAQRPRRCCPPAPLGRPRGRDGLRGRRSGAWERAAPAAAPRRSSPRRQYGARAENQASSGLRRHRHGFLLLGPRTAGAGRGRSHAVACVEERMLERPGPGPLPRLAGQVRPVRAPGCQVVRARVLGGR